MSGMNPSDAAAVESRLKQLQARLAETASQSSRRLTITSLVMASLLVAAFFICGSSRRASRRTPRHRRLSNWWQPRSSRGSRRHRPNLRPR